MARACLLDTLRAQESAAQNPDLKVTAQERLGVALWARGEFMESQELAGQWPTLLDSRERTLGDEHRSTLTSVALATGRMQSRSTGELWRAGSVAIRQKLGNLPPRNGPAERCRAHESSRGQQPHPWCRAS